MKKSKSPSKPKGNADSSSFMQHAEEEYTADNYGVRQPSPDGKATAAPPRIVPHKKFTSPMGDKNKGGKATRIMMGRSRRS